MKMLSLFSGIGGIDLAAEWAGFETVAFCEFDPFCQKVLKKHWPDVPVFGDIKRLTYKRLMRKLYKTGAINNEDRSIDVICGGYPCQPFSVAGKREGEEDDRHLWPYVKQLLQEVGPRWFIGENVAGHVTLGLDTVLADLESIGYTSQAFVIPACAVNAPHRRDRVFIVAHSDSQRCKKFNLSSKSTQQRFCHRGNYERKDAPHTSCESKSQTDKTFSSVGKERNTWSDLARWSRGDVSGTYWETNQPPIPGVDDGVPDRVDRVRSLGNAVVPQHIYPVFDLIAKLEAKAI